MIKKLINRVIEREIITKRDLEEQILPLRSEIGTLRFEVQEQLKLKKREAMAEVRAMLLEATEKIHASFEARRIADQ